MGLTTINLTKVAKYNFFAYWRQSNREISFPSHDAHRKVV